jgi:cyclopropane fatty-acyl-phospholipid synthase-like methyltransferase
MEGMEYLYELFESLPRGGPGDSESTRRAYESIPKPPKTPSILDIGCGPGEQTIELAKITDGKIIALDNHKPFLDQLMKTAKEEGVAEKIVPKNISMHKMDFEETTFDIIWSEGALYFMGFQNGLKRCHGLLKKDGYLAVTEIAYLTPDPPEPLVQYFETEYPDIRFIEENIKLIQKERFRLLSHFTLPKSSWILHYYQPMERELARLSAKYEGNEVALDAFAAMKYEIDIYKKYSDSYGYEFYVMQREDPSNR